MQKLNENIDEFLIKEEPHYCAVGEEIILFEAAWKNKLPAMLT